MIITSVWCTVWCALFWSGEWVSMSFWWSEESGKVMTRTSGQITYMHTCTWILLRRLENISTRISLPNHDVRETIPTHPVTYQCELHHRDLLNFCGIYGSGSDIHVTGRTFLMEYQCDERPENLGSENQSSGDTASLYEIVSVCCMRAAKA